MPSQPSDSLRGIPRSHRSARSRPLTLREGGVLISSSQSAASQPIIPPIAARYAKPQRRGTPLWLPRCGAEYAKRITAPNVHVGVYRPRG